MFLLKSMIKGWINPLPFAAAFLLVGVVLLWFPKRQQLGRGLATAGLALLMLFSLGFWSGPLIYGYERTYPPYARQGAVQWVVVLSGGFTDEPGLPANSAVSTIGLARLVEGLRILSLHPEARLLLAGGSASPYKKSTEAQLDREIATTMGVDPERIVLEEKGRDTEEQAAAVRRIIGDDSLVLVTSALHLPRSMTLFRAQGMSPLPAPADYLVWRDQERRFSLAGTIRPSAAALDNLTVSWHEWLGVIWSRLRGRG